MQRIKLPILFCLVLFCMAFLNQIDVRAGEPITISKNFTLFTSKNMQGFFKPLFTSIEQSFNSNIYTTAQYPQKFYFGLDFSAMGMFIPDGQRNFNAERPDMYGRTDIVKTAEVRGSGILRDVTNENLQPTVYGGTSTAIFAVPQVLNSKDTVYKSTAFVDGNNISFMSGIPTIQLIFGIPTRTELRFRFWGAPVQGESLWYYGILLNQQLDHFFKLFPKEYNMALALNGGYHSLSRDPGLSLSSWNVGLHFSKIWDYEKSGKITGYFGFQLENMSGTFEAVKDTTGMTAKDFVDSPYEELRNPKKYKTLKFDIESLNKYRIMLGFSYKISFLELHGDIAYASQPILTAGLTFWLGSFGGKRDIEPGERIEKIEEGR